MIMISLLFILILNIVAAMCSANRSLSDIIEDILARKDYNSRIRPQADSGEPLLVYLNLNINDISSISEVEMEFSLTMFLRQTWIDSRLRFDAYHNRSVTLNYNQYHRIWTPDLFFRNLKAGEFHTITVPNRLIRLSPDGTVLYSQRLSLTLSCEMLLERFPMDNQSCKIDFGSYGYTTEDLVFAWKDVKDPVIINDDISLPDFTVTGVVPTTCQTKYTTTGSFPCLHAHLHLRRRLKFYILQVYLPSMLIVLLSMVSFWIDLDSVPARTSLGILTILTITTQSSGTSKGGPSVSLTKAIDVWMAACLVFVFGAFIEYSIVNVLARREASRKKKLKEFQARQQLQERTEREKIEGTGCPSCPLTCRSTRPLSQPDSDCLHASIHRSAVSLTDDSVSECRQRYVLKGGQIISEQYSITTPRVSVHPPVIRGNACSAQSLPIFNNITAQVQQQKPPLTNHVAPRFYDDDGRWGNAQLVDVISRVAFPALFALFNLVYWPLYMAYY